MNFGLIFEGVSVVTAVLAVITAGGVKAALLFASWASKKVATFFDGYRSADEGQRVSARQGGAWVDRRGRVHGGD